MHTQSARQLVEFFVRVLELHGQSRRYCRVNPTDLIPGASNRTVRSMCLRRPAHKFIPDQAVSV